MVAMTTSCCVYNVQCIKHLRHLAFCILTMCRKSSVLFNKKKQLLQYIHQIQNITCTTNDSLPWTMKCPSFPNHEYVHHLAHRLTDQLSPCCPPQGTGWRETGWQYPGTGWGQRRCTPRGTGSTCVYLLTSAVCQIRCTARKRQKIIYLIYLL